MAFRAPTRTQLLLVFLILAPACWSLSLYVMSYAGLIKESFFKQGGFGFFFLYVAWWYFGLLMTWAWFFTWIPTVVAALVSERALHFICGRYRALFGTRLALVCVFGVVCGLIYAAVFAISIALVAHQQVPTQIGPLSQIVLSVGITGAILGVIVGAWPRLTPSTTRDSNASVFTRWPTGLRRPAARYALLAVLVIGAIILSWVTNRRDPQLERGWVTNCVGPEFSRFARNGAPGPGPERPVFRISDQLVLAVPKKYWPWSQSIDHEPRTCTKISDLPVVRVIYFYVQGNWSAGYKTSDLPFGISGQRLQPDRVMVRVEDEPAPKLSTEDRKAAEENRRKVERLWGEPREIAGLTCSAYCWKGQSGDSDFVQLKYEVLNPSFIQIYAAYWSPRYGGTGMHWQVVISDLSHWRDIDDEVWKLIADWNLLNNVEAQADQPKAR